MVRTVAVGLRRYTARPASIGGGQLAFIAGPCVIESEDATLRIAEHLVKVADALGVPLVFKASFDKANRTNLRSWRGPGLEFGLRILAKVGEETGLPVTTDVHEVCQVEPVAGVVDLLQIPALLARQTDLLAAAARTGLPVNVKKGQFMAPHDMRWAVDKVVAAAGRANVILTERGTTFGYNNLVVDMRSIPWMRQQLVCPVVFDASHSVQRPGMLGGKSDGDRDMIPHLARAAVAAGCDGVFVEVHPDPDKALSDGPNSLRLDQFEAFARGCLAVRQAVRGEYSGD